MKQLYHLTDLNDFHGSGHAADSIPVTFGDDRHIAGA